MKKHLTLQAVKMHGIGNDFVLLDNPRISDELFPEIARTICDRHFGIGADGLLVVQPSVNADAAMRIFNADGSEAQMCGNGIRCVGKYIYETKKISTLTPTIETRSCLKKLLLHADADSHIIKATVDMGIASRYLSDSPVEMMTSCGKMRVTPVSTGNPHGVIFVDSLSSLPLSKIGPELENNPLWPDRANIEFIHPVADHIIEQRTWERGVGETLACGTGACAAAYAYVDSGLGAWPVTVRLLGGELTIDCDSSSRHLFMTGNAVTAFTTDFTFTLIS